MKVQSLIFDRDEWTPARAIKWAQKHGYRTSKLTQTEHSYRLRQMPPGNFKVLRTIELGEGRGIKAVVGR